MAASIAGYPQTRSSEEIIYETPKREPVRDVDDYEYDDEFLEEDAKKFDRESVGFVTTHTYCILFTRGGFLTRNTE